jgi:hypothetical protein
MWMRSNFSGHSIFNIQSLLSRVSTSPTSGRILFISHTRFDEQRAQPESLAGG